MLVIHVRILVILILNISNWQIPDQSTSNRDVSVNSNNKANSTESMNVAPSLETGWEIQVNK